MRSRFDARVAAIAVLAAAFAALASTPATAQPSCFAPFLYTVSDDDNIVREYDATDLTLVAEYTIDIPGQTIEGIPGIAIDPTSEQIYLLMRFAGTPGGAPWLVQADLEGGLYDIRGNVVNEFICLSFDADGVLHSTTSAAAPSRRFCTLNLDTGGPSDICGFTTGDGAEALAYHPGLQQFFRAAGDLAVVFEQISDSTVDPCGATSVSVAMTPLADAPVGGLTWSDGHDAFLWATIGGMGPGGELYTVDETGSATLLGLLDHNVADLAVKMVPTPCITDIFRRGDANDDGGLDISDAVYVLASLFVPGSPAPTCADTGDANDDGSADISDAVYILAGLFVPGSPPPPPPHIDCGEDPTPDLLDCETYLTCP